MHPLFTPLWLQILPQALEMVHGDSISWQVASCQGAYEQGTGKRFLPHLVFTSAGPVLTALSLGVFLILQVLFINNIHIPLVLCFLHHKFLFQNL